MTTFRCPCCYCIAQRADAVRRSAKYVPPITAAAFEERELARMKGRNMAFKAVGSTVYVGGVSPEELMGLEDEP